MRLSKKFLKRVRTPLPALTERRRTELMAVERFLLLLHAVPICVWIFSLGRNNIGERFPICAIIAEICAVLHAYLNSERVSRSLRSSLDRRQNRFPRTHAC